MNPAETGQPVKYPNVNPMHSNKGTALVTGASSGIGAEFAKQLHAAGWDLVLLARRHELLEAHARAFNLARPDSARVWIADLTSQELATIEERLGTTRVDLLVNNAGRGSFGAFADLDLQEELAMVALNVIAPFRLTHIVLQQMRARRSGAIITVSSIAAFQPLPYMATYAATKAFEFIHSLALRHELANEGIKVLTVCPGPTATEFKGVSRIPGKLTGIKRDSPERVVRETLKALERDQGFVIPGIMAKLSAFVAWVLPWNLNSLIAGKILRSSLHNER